MFIKIVFMFLQIISFLHFIFTGILKLNLFVYKNALDYVFLLL